MPRSARRSEAPPGPAAAPGELETVRALVNSSDLDLGTDELATPAGLAGWLQRNGLAPDGQPAAVTRTDLEQAVALREALRGVLRAHTGGPAAGGPAGDLRRIAAGLATRLEVSEDGRVVAVPAGPGVPGALARILLIAAEAAAVGTWPRLKACAADDCRWAFYDRSPTRTGCWCSMQVCGARAKSRAYRRRTSGAAAAAPVRPGAGPARRSSSGRTAR